MNLNLKLLGLSLAVALACGAVAGHAAQASEFAWDAGTTLLKLEQDATGGEQVFTFNLGKIECDQMRGDAAVEGTSSPDLSLTAITYSDSAKEADHCLGPFGTAPKIGNLGGCAFAFHAGTGSGGSSTGTADFLCSSGNPFRLEFLGCELVVPEQSGLSSIAYRTVADTPSDLTIEPIVSNIEYHQGGSLCTTETTKNGTYTGTMTVKGFNELGEQTNVKAVP